MSRCFLWIRHKIVYIKGYGYRCKYCGKSKSQIEKELMQMRKQKYNFKHCMINKCDSCKRRRKCDEIEKKRGDNS